MDKGIRQATQGVLSAYARIGQRDPRALVSPTRREYWAEIDQWELRFQSVTGKSREEVWKLIKQLPTGRDDGSPDPKVLRQAYTRVFQGTTFEDVVRTTRMEHDTTGTE